MKTSTIGLLSICRLALMACSKQDAASNPVSISAAEAAKLLPSDAGLAGIYQRSCQSFAIQLRAAAHR